MVDIKTLIRQRQENMPTSKTKTKEPNPTKCWLCGKDIRAVWDWDHWNIPIVHNECKYFIYRMERVGIHKRYWKLPPELIEEGNKKAFEAVDKFIKNPIKGLYLWGEAGTGKTYFSVKIFQALKDAQFIKAPRFLLSLKSNFENKGSSWKNEERIDKLSKAPILIIDDLGAEKASDWVSETFYVLIDERYSRMLPTVITSNFSLDELTSRLGDRICSRIIEMCKIIKIKTNDKREFMRKKT